MNIIIHRGTNQIGGSVTEINTNSARIFVDLGSELPDENGNDQQERLTLDGVTAGQVNCDAILFSHYHGDHIGMLSKVLPDIPMFMGSAAKEIYLVLQKRMRDGISDKVETINTYTQNNKFSIKDIDITPFSVDHSAYDAYMFLIEAEGKRILYTGDYRNHGFRGKGLLPTLKKYIGQIDVLITEGTILSRDDKDCISEQDVQMQEKEFLNKFKYVFVVCSSTNIDRIGGLYQATPRGKYFICDSYQKDVLNIVEKAAGHFSPLYQFRKALSYGENLKMKMENLGFCMLVRSGNNFRNILDYYREYHNEETLVIFSMWKGYLNQPGNLMLNMIAGFKNVEYLHSSGHATTQTIIDVCNAVSPRQAIIPIHSTNSRKLDSLGMPYHIEYLLDGQVYGL